MELKKIKKGYYINISNREISQLITSKNDNPKKQVALIINLVINLIKAIGIDEIGERIKINLVKEADSFKIIISPLSETFSSFAMKINNEKELLILIKQLHKNNCSKFCISSIYILSNNYYLLITPLTRNRKLKMLCTEFCLDIITNMHEIQNIQCHGKEICSINAIDKLGESI